MLSSFFQSPVIPPAKVAKKRVAPASTTALSSFCHTNKDVEAGDDSSLVDLSTPTMHKKFQKAFCESARKHMFDELLYRMLVSS